MNLLNFLRDNLTVEQKDSLLSNKKYELFVLVEDGNIYGGVSDLGQTNLELVLETKFPNIDSIKIFAPQELYRVDFVKLYEQYKDINPIEPSDWCDVFFDIFAEYGNWDKRFSTRVSTQKIVTWLCTDTTVGLYAHYLDGEFVCLSYQRGRKCNTEFYWKDNESYQKMKAWVLELLGEEEESFMTLDSAYALFRCHYAR